MSLLFGNLTQDFVNFAVAIQNADPNDPATTAKVEEAARGFRHVAAKDASYLTLIGACIQTASHTSDVVLKHCPFTVGLGMFVCTFIYMIVWVYTAEVTAKRIRELYLKAVLRQDIAFFDNVGAGEITTRIQTDTR